MCGIAGICHVSGRPAQREVVERMTTALAHRGPDDADVFVDGAVALGHRRLSILDLTARGRQPMTLRGSGLTIVYNGEVFNYVELRRELERSGQIFETGTDTEVVLAAYRAWGSAAFARFDGMWALAIHDERTGQLLLCRDRYGMKPLYLYRRGDTVAFASEYKAFFAARRALELEFDVRGVVTALRDPFHLEASGRSLLEGVTSVAPGTLLRVREGRVDEERWWSTLDHLEEPPGSAEAQALGLRERLEESCRVRMRSDVPVGTSLSGGLDSSSVVALLASGGQRAPIGYCHVFPGSTLDESGYARIVAESTGTPLVEVRAERELDREELDASLLAFESIYPGMPDSAHRVYRAQRADGVFVSVDGHGADEMLGGYPWYVEEAIRDTMPWRTGRLRELRETAAALQGPGGRAPGASSVARLLFGGTALGAALRRGRASRHPGHGDDFLAVRQIPSYEAPLPALPRGWSHLRRRLYLDFHHLVLPRILRNFDLVSMANGVEVRMPFLDHRVVSYAFSLPDSAYIGAGYTKRVLRDATRGVLDDRVRLRRMKIGFNSPLHEWLGTRLRGWTEEILNEPEYDYGAIDRARLRDFYRTRILGTSSPRWDDVLSFWKYLSALKVLRLLAASAPRGEAT